tara:strand:+ start:235 stop:1164 length:930 start_codon:yes stop_codon:yes gene_type:complete
MKKILVTGGAGFIGSHLCKYLIKKNNYVICVDDLSTGNKNNISALFNYPNFQFINHNILEILNIEVDEIYHFACPASPIQYQINPINTFKTCIIGTMNIIDLALKNNAKILHASTSEIYGDPLQNPQNEEYWGNVNPIGIRSCYNESKRAIESLLFDYKRYKHLELKICRIFNTYGPNMDPNDGRVISNFINQAINNNPITIYGKGNQTRSFCYVADLVDGIFKLMNIGHAIDTPVNLGNPEEISILDLAKKVLLLTNSNSKINYKKLPDDDPRKRKPDIELAKKLLLWSPKINLDDGLKKTISFFNLK